MLSSKIFTRLVICFFIVSGALVFLYLALAEKTLEITPASLNDLSLQIEEGAFIKLVGRPEKIVSGSESTFFLYDLASSSKFVKVKYPRPLPFVPSKANMLAIGRYSKSEKIFIANEVIVMCPSKYREQDAGPSMGPDMGPDI